MNVGRRKLPVLARLVEPFHETILLFLARHIEKELEDDGPLAGEVILEMRDVGEPLVPDVFADKLGGQLLAPENFLVHANDQSFFVVRAIENPDASTLGQ